MFLTRSSPEKTIRVSVEDRLSQQLYYSVSISVGGVFTGTVYLHSGETKDLVINVEPKVLATLFSQYKAIPVPVLVELLSNGNPGTVMLKITNTVIGEFTIRLLYTIEFSDDTILYSSTREANDSIWDRVVYGVRGRFHVVLVYSNIYPDNVYLNNYVVDVRKSIISQQVIANYKLVFMNKSYTESMDLGNGRSQAIHMYPADKIEINITFPINTDLSGIHGILRLDLGCDRVSVDLRIIIMYLIFTHICLLEVYMYICYSV